MIILVEMEVYTVAPHQVQELFSNPHDQKNCIIYGKIYVSRWVQQIIWAESKENYILLVHFYN